MFNFAQTLFGGPPNLPWLLGIARCRKEDGANEMTVRRQLPETMIPAQCD